MEGLFSLLFYLIFEKPAAKGTKRVLIGSLYIYIFFVHARRLHDLFVHFGRNALRMHSMHSECILDQNQDPRFPQDSWLKS